MGWSWTKGSWVLLVAGYSKTGFCVEFPRGARPAPQLSRGLHQPATELSGTHHHDGKAAWINPFDILSEEDFFGPKTKEKSPSQPLCAEAPTTTTTTSVTKMPEGGGRLSKWRNGVSLALGGATDGGARAMQALAVQSVVFGREACVWLKRRWRTKGVYGVLGVVGLRLATRFVARIKASVLSNGDIFLDSEDRVLASRGAIMDKEGQALLLRLSALGSPALATATTSADAIQRQPSWESMATDENARSSRAGDSVGNDGAAEEVVGVSWESVESNLRHAIGLRFVGQGGGGAGGRAKYAEELLDALRGLEQARDDAVMETFGVQHASLVEQAVLLLQSRLCDACLRSLRDGLVKASSDLRELSSFWKSQSSTHRRMGVVKSVVLGRLVHGQVSGKRVAVERDQEKVSSSELLLEGYLKRLGNVQAHLQARPKAFLLTPESPSTTATSGAVFTQGAVKALEGWVDEGAGILLRSLENIEAAFEKQNISGDGKSIDNGATPGSTDDREFFSVELDVAPVAFQSGYDAAECEVVGDDDADAVQVDAVAVPVLVELRGGGGDGRDDIGDGLLFFSNQFSSKTASRSRRIPAVILLRSKPNSKKSTAAADGEGGGGEPRLNANEVPAGGRRGRKRIKTMNPAHSGKMTGDKAKNENKVKVGDGGAGWRGRIVGGGRESSVARSKQNTLGAKGGQKTAVKPQPENVENLITSKRAARSARAASSSVKRRTADPETSAQKDANSAVRGNSKFSGFGNRRGAQECQDRRRDGGTAATPPSRLRAAVALLRPGDGTTKGDTASPKQQTGVKKRRDESSPRPASTAATAAANADGDFDEFDDIIFVVDSTSLSSPTGLLTPDVHARALQRDQNYVRSRRVNLTGWKQSARLNPTDVESASGGEHGASSELDDPSSNNVDFPPSNGTITFHREVGSFEVYATRCLAACGSIAEDLSQYTASVLSLTARLGRTIAASVALGKLDGDDGDYDHDADCDATEDTDATPDADEAAPGPSAGNAPSASVDGGGIEATAVDVDEQAASASEAAGAMAASAGKLIIREWILRPVSQTVLDPCSFVCEAAAGAMCGLGGQALSVGGGALRVARKRARQCLEGAACMLSSPMEFARAASRRVPQGAAAKLRRRCEHLCILVGKGVYTGCVVATASACLAGGIFVKAAATTARVGAGWAVHAGRALAMGSGGACRSIGRAGENISRSTTEAVTAGCLVAAATACMLGDAAAQGAARSRKACRVLLVALAKTVVRMVSIVLLPFARGGSAFKAKGYAGKSGRAATRAQVALPSVVRISPVGRLARWATRGATFPASLLRSRSSGPTLITSSPLIDVNVDNPLPTSRAQEAEAALALWLSSAPATGASEASGRRSRTLVGGAARAGRIQAPGTSSTGAGAVGLTRGLRALAAEEVREAGAARPAHWRRVRRVAKLAVVAPVTLRSARYANRNRADLRLVATEAATGVSSFFSEQLWQPCEAITKQVLFRERTNLMDKDTLDDAETSLQNMLRDFVYDETNKVPEDLRSQAVEAMDMSVVSRKLEQETKSSIRGTVNGRIPRMLLIQATFLKKELLHAMQSIDDLFQANQVTLRLISVIPAALLIFAGVKVTRPFVHAASSRRLEPTAVVHRSMRASLRKIERLLTSSRGFVGGQEGLDEASRVVSRGLLDYEEIGNLMLHLHELQTILRQNCSRFDSRARRRLEEDLADLTARGRPTVSQQLAVVYRMQRSYPFLRPDGGSRGRRAGGGGGEGGGGGQ